MNKSMFTFQSLLLKIVMITFFSIMFFQCKTEEDLPEPEKPKPEEEVPVITKAAFDDNFEWDRLDKFPIYNPNIGRIDNIELPWAKGSTVSMGIPSEWLDPNAYNPVFKERYYSRENNWVLVYSNMTKNTANKYFALYNTHMGLLRFLFMLYQMLQVAVIVIHIGGLESINQLLCLILQLSLLRI